MFTRQNPLGRHLDLSFIIYGFKSIFFLRYFAIKVNLLMFKTGLVLFVYLWAELKMNSLLFTKSKTTKCPMIGKHEIFLIKNIILVGKLVEK